MKQKTNYVDGFVLVVPKKHLVAYKKMAKMGEKMWKKYGVLDYKECVGDDMKPDTMGMPMLTFPKLTQCKPSEVVVFSYITYTSKAHRDSVNKKVMKDPFMDPEKHPEMKEMPFDMKRFAHGGFTVIVGA